MRVRFGLMVTMMIVLAVFIAPAGSVQAASHEAVRGANGMVASRSMIASQVGVAIMKQGGNAIDAAVATGFALAVTYPSAGNLGGGGFMVIRLADGTVVTNDHREVAPAGASRDMYLDEAGQLIKGLSTASHLAVGVPGSVAGLLDVHERYGELTRRQVIAPALRLARRGFALPHDLSRQFARVLPRMAKYPASLRIFADRDGVAWPAGTVWKQRDLARTLQRIARHGRAGFYDGPVADGLVAEMAANGGLITHEDLAAYTSKWREPIQGTYRGFTLYSMPPPSSGGVLLVQMLNMLSAHDLKGSGYGAAATMHTMIEAERRAYADRAEHLGDSDFYDVPIAMLTDPEYAQARFADFDPQRASDSARIGAGQWPPEGRDTTHLSVVDGAGNAVAFTTTLNSSYGAKMVAAGTGVLLNNEMDDFSAKENTPNSFGLLGRAANAIAPGKRMLSSMTPTIVTRDGKLELVTGSPGGSTIITTVLQVIVNTIDHGMSLSDVVGKPRFHHQWRPDRVLVEQHGVSPDTLAKLAAMGHKNIITARFGRGIGDANSVRVVAGELQGMSDPRNDGGAAGY